MSAQTKISILANISLLSAEFIVHNEHVLYTLNFLHIQAKADPSKTAPKITGSIGSFMGYFNQVRLLLGMATRMEHLKVIYCITNQFSQIRVLGSD